MFIPTTGLNDHDLDLIGGAAAVRHALGFTADAAGLRALKSGELDGVVMKIGKGKRKRLCGRQLHSCGVTPVVEVVA
jgi:hypothetical protein